MEISRPEKFGGNAAYASYEDLEKDFGKGNLHPADLKRALAKSINQMLQPVRDYFDKNKEAKLLKEKVESYSITR